MPQTTPMKPILALLVIAALAAGCARVPKTSISFNPKTRKLDIRSPKDIEIQNLSARIGTNGETVIAIESYAGRNNAEVINAVAAQNAAAMQKIAELGGQAIGEAAKRLH